MRQRFFFWGGGQREHVGHTYKTLGIRILGGSRCKAVSTMLAALQKSAYLRSFKSAKAVRSLSRGTFYPHPIIADGEK